MPTAQTGVPRPVSVREGRNNPQTDKEEAQALTATDLERTLEALEGRDTHLWSIVVLVILILAAGFAALLFPNVIWHVGTVQIEGSYVPQLFFGFIVLVVLFNIYALDQRRRLRRTRDELVRQIARREAAEREALIDPLTGTFNRRYMDHMVAREASRADRLGSNLTLMVIDVDDFRSVNTRFGHPEGDRFLKEVAQVLTKTFRSSDTIIRYGGDEFLAVLPEADEQQAQRAVARLLTRVAEWNRAHPEAGYKMKLSCGLAAYRKGAEVADVLQIADQRMYLHKGQPAPSD
jgi:diguanylate cyclase (GGDEF)-like protein